MSLAGSHLVRINQFRMGTAMDGSHRTDHAPVVSYEFGGLETRGATRTFARGGGNLLFCKGGKG